MILATIFTLLSFQSPFTAAPEHYKLELDNDWVQIVRVHYDKVIEPAAPFQDYGVEDARISRIDDLWYMTTIRSVRPSWSITPTEDR